MGFKRKLRWLILVLIPLLLLTGCGDLEPEMQDTRTVILNMDFDQRSSSRTSRAELINVDPYKTHINVDPYKTHLIMVLTSGENLSNSSYWNYNSNLGEYVLYDSDRKITLNMKLNTKMKIFAFLFRENYSHYDLFSANREAGYYGESQSFTIYSDTDSLQANIRLTPVSGTDTAGGTDTDTPTELEGAWKTVCFTNSDNTSTIETVILEGNVLTIKDEKHSDTSCATDYSLTESSHTFSIGDTGKFLITLGSTIKRTPQSTSAVSSYNSSSNCGYSDWELNTAKDCTNEDAGDPIYCFYQLSGNTLYVECNESSYPTTSDIDTSDASSTFTKQ